MSKKPLIICTILTVLAKIAQKISGLLSSKINAVVDAISGSAPEPVPSGFHPFKAIAYASSTVAYKSRQLGAAVLTAPLRSVNAIFSFIGKLFIPLLIITIIILIITIIMSIVKRSKVKARRGAVRNEEVVDIDNYGNNSAVFRRM